MPEWTWECCFVPPYVRRKPLLVALKRPSDSGIFEGFSWSVQGRYKLSFHTRVPRFRRSQQMRLARARTSESKKPWQICDLSAVLNLKFL